MELLLNLGWTFVSPDQMLVRHYFLEQLNKPAYIWGIRAVCVMTAVLFFFLYQKLKANMEAIEAAASGEVMAGVDSSEVIDDVPVIEIAFAPEPASMPEIESVPENVPTREPVSAPETAPIPELESMPEPESVFGQEAAPEPELVFEQETTPEPESVFEQEVTPELESISEPGSITEHTPKREAEIKSAGKPVALSKLLGPDAESNIWLWALVGVSVSIGGMVLLSIYKRKRRVA